nr:hypothetical protein [Prevotella sp.]
MKNIKSFLLLALLSIIMVSCGGNDPLKTQVDAINSKGQIPYQITEWATVSELQYNEGMLAIGITINETDLVTIDKIQKNSKDVTAALANFIFGTKGSLNSLAPLIKQTKSAISIKLTGSNSKKTVEETISPAEAAKFAAATTPDVALKTRLAMDNLTTPYDVNDFVKQDARTLDGDKMVFTLLVKSSSFDGKLSGKELKKFLISIFTDPTDPVSDYPALLVAAKKGAKWIYKNEDSGAQLTSEFTVDELSGLQKKE